MLLLSYGADSSFSHILFSGMNGFKVCSSLASPQLFAKKKRKMLNKMSSKNKKQHENDSDVVYKTFFVAVFSHTCTGHTPVRAAFMTNRFVGSGEQQQRRAAERDESTGRKTRQTNE